MTEALLQDAIPLVVGMGKGRKMALECGIWYTWDNETGPKVLETPTTPGTANRCRRSVAMLEVYPEQQQKRCSSCGEVKPVSAFHKSPRGLYGVHSQCINCRRTRRDSDEYRDQKREYDRRRYESMRTEWNERTAAWYAANSERHKVLRDRWKAAHPELLREYDRRRYERERVTSEGPIDYAFILDREDYRCYLCGEEVDPENFHFDHVIPLSKGGPNTVDNIRVAHPKCNLRKGRKLL